MEHCFLISAVILILCINPVLAQKNWPSFRGGAQGGVGKGENLPVLWDAKKNVLWNVKIPGKGWSSPIVWGDRVYVTSVTSEEKTREPRKGLYIGDVRGKKEPGKHHWWVHCLDLKTGSTIWKREAFAGEARGTIHLKNSYASETPVTDGERVYAYFGNLGIFCYDKDGKKLWEKKLDPVQTRFGWGPAASPVIYKKTLFIVNDNETSSYLIALRAKDGKELWKVKRPEKSNWATPFVWENEKRVEIVTPGTTKIRSYSLDGKQLWELGGSSSISIPTPVAAHGLLYVTSGYILDFRRPLYAIRPGASGDITLKADEKSNKHIAWAQKLGGPYHPSPLVYGDYIYILYDQGGLSCYEAKTGKEMYKKKKIARAPFTSSPWAHNGKIFCLSEDGETFVIQAGPEFKVLGSNKLTGEMTLATPALAQQSLFLRTINTLYRIGKKQADE